MIASYSAMAAPLLRSCSRVVTDQLSYSTAPMLPLSVALRRWYHPNGLNRNHTTTTAAASARWLHCRARLYARYLLTLAAAQTASLNHRTRLEEGSMNQLTPLEWNDWSRKEWSAELLQRLGSNPVTRVWNATKRVLQLALLATPLLVVLPFSFYSQRLEQWSWSYALWGIEQAGPTFIKLTQWATTRQDLFSPEFCQYFGKLRDETIGHTWQETLEILQSAQEEFTHVVTMETTPIGSGCIAQVYRGTLLQACGQHPAGTEIAIKVQHPGIWHKVCVDFYLFDKLAGFLEGLPGFNLQYLSLRDTIRQFRDIMLPQLDLTLERNHLKRFLRDFSGDEQVSFPRPIDELTSTRVLTETFVHGRPIMEFTGPDTPQAVKVELANLGLNTTLKMMFVHDCKW
jgi:aarF domain-containing kinase